MEVAADHGYREGLIVPFHFSDAIGRIYSSLVVFFWSDPLKRFQFMIRLKHHELHILMIYWAQRMVELLGKSLSKGTCFTAKEPAQLRDRLTDRERDVLAWAARGKTAADTADILGVSEETVNTHVRHALKKLGATSKTHGVAKAIYLGLIDL
jgi:DNA-binding CsgD family transcriptional regulator